MFVGVFGGFQGVFWWVPVGLLVGFSGVFAGFLGFVVFGGFSGSSRPTGFQC